MTTNEQALTTRKRFWAGALFCAVLLSISMPHLFLPLMQASLLALIFCMACAIFLATLLKKGSKKVQIGICAFVFFSLILTSASVGLFFHLPIKLALLYFMIVSFGGAIFLSAFGVFLSTRVFSEFPENDNGKQAPKRQ